MTLDEKAAAYAEHKLMGTDLPGLGREVAFMEFLSQAMDVLTFVESLKKSK